MEVKEGPRSMAKPRLVQADQALREFEPLRVITVRLSTTYHRILKRVAHERSSDVETISINDVCLERLLYGHEEEIAATLTRHRASFKGPVNGEPHAPGLLRT